MITLVDLRLAARRRSDMEKSNFVGDGELTSYINHSIAELYDILCEAYGSEYYVQSEEGSTTADEDSYDLPDDFYELKGVDLKINAGEWTTIKRFNFNERNRAQNNGSWDGISQIRYRIIGGQIKFSPIPDAATEYRIWYVPLPTQLAADDDTLDDLNAYSEYVIVDAAIKMLQKEESDVSVLMMQKQQLEKRIRDKSQNRDAAVASTISDVGMEYDDIWHSGVDDE